MFHMHQLGFLKSKGKMHSFQRYKYENFIAGVINYACADTFSCTHEAFIKVCVKIGYYQCMDSNTVFDGNISKVLSQQFSVK